MGNILTCFLEKYGNLLFPQIGVRLGVSGELGVSLFVVIWFCFLLVISLCFLSDCLFCLVDYLFKWFLGLFAFLVLSGICFFFCFQYD